MFLQGRLIIVWLSWLIGGICGVFVLLIIICYCRLMPRHQKSFDEKYVKDGTIKESHVYSSHDSYRIKHAEVQVVRHGRPQSCAGAVEPRPPDPRPHHHHASSTMLEDMESAASIDALKTRSLPAFLRPKPRPLSTEDDLQQLYAKVNLSKKYKNRMRSEHAAIIALSRVTASAPTTHADAVIVYNQRTQL